jgi:DNA-binding response OmpR family regulator
MLEVSTPKKTILVVDDDKSILRTFTRILQKSDYEIETAETGKEAIEKAENRQYDLALVDIRLPDMDGTDLLAKLKNQLQKTVKIMITGFPSLETGVKALDEGADAYLVKPVKPQELLVLLEEKLKNRFSFFKLQKPAKDISIPSGEFAADDWFACGFAVGEFAMDFWVNKGSVNLFGGSFWDNYCLFNDCYFLLQSTTSFSM